MLHDLKPGGNENRLCSNGHFNATSQIHGSNLFCIKETPVLLLGVRCCQLCNLAIFKKEGIRNQKKEYRYKDEVERYTLILHINQE